MVILKRAGKDPLNAVILAGGFDLHRHSYLRDTPIPLLKIAGRPLLDLIIERLAGVGMFETIYVLTNGRSHEQFVDWQSRVESVATAPHVEIVSNDIESQRNSPGATGDLAYLVDSRNLDSDLLVVGGDNFIDFDLRQFLACFRQHRASCIAVYQTRDRTHLASRFGVVVQAKNGRIVQFHEKPESPASSLASTLCYLLSRADAKELDTYARSAAHRPGIGSFVQHLVENGHRVYAFPGVRRWYDIGNIDHYRALVLREATSRFAKQPDLRQPIEAVILFADIIDSVYIAEHTSPRQYDLFISEFQRIAGDVIDTNLRAAGYTAQERSYCEYSVRGDEIVLILYTSSPERDAKTAIAIAIELKRRWLVSDFNRRRSGRTLYDVGVGIHYGSVMLGRHPSAKLAGQSFNAEGYSISRAKRIEQFARQGRVSRIMLSKALIDLASKAVSMKVSPRVDAQLTGIYGGAPVYELEVHGDIEDPEIAPAISPRDIAHYIAALESNRYDLWLLLMVARYFYDEERYVVAQDYYNQAIQLFPNFAVGYVFLGRSLYRQRYVDRAQLQLQRAYEIKPDSCRVNSYLAVAYRRLGNYDKARDHHAQATRSPDATGYDFNAFAYTLAEAEKDGAGVSHLEEAARYADVAERLFRRGGTLPKVEYLTQHTRGLIALKEGDAEKAKGCFERALACLLQSQDLGQLKMEEKRQELAYHCGLSCLRLLTKRRPSFRDEANRRFHESIESDGTASGNPYYWIEDAKTRIQRAPGRVDRRRSANLRSEESSQHGRGAGIASRDSVRTSTSLMFRDP